MIIPVELQVRNRMTTFQDVTFALAVATQPSESELASQLGVSPQLRHIANNPEWSTPVQHGFQHYFKKHNDFRGQELYDRIARDTFEMHAHVCMYYATSYNPDSDKIWHEDSNRQIQRVFEIRAAFELQPENEMYSVLGLQALDKFDGHIQISSFLQWNYQSLRENGVGPDLPVDEHNPILYQRGYDSFNYHGYAACQIFPKPGDLVKMEAYDKLYVIEALTDADPQYQHQYRKFFWKISMQEYRDDAKSISPEVTNDPRNNQFIEGLFGNAGVITQDTQGQELKSSQFDVTAEVDEAKLDGVIFRPPQVPKEIKDPTSDSRFYPGFEHNGGW